MSMNLLAKANFGGDGITGPSPLSDNLTTNERAVGTGEMIISNLLSALTVVAGLIFIYYFVTGAIFWITAGGEQGKIQKARDRMTQATIGLVTVVFTYGILGLIGQIVGIDLLRPGMFILENLNPTKP